MARLNDQRAPRDSPATRAARRAYCTFDGEHDEQLGELERAQVFFEIRSVRALKTTGSGVYRIPTATNDFVHPNNRSRMTRAPGNRRRNSEARTNRTSRK
jgi:hypothetical protein